MLEKTQCSHSTSSQYISFKYWNVCKYFFSFSLFINSLSISARQQFEPSTFLPTQKSPNRSDFWNLHQTTIQMMIEQQSSPNQLKS